MRRCAVCIMPESAVGIRFSEKGTCQLCDSFRPYVPLGEELLGRKLSKFRAQEKECNCVVPVSGGRDSAYALYYAKKVLGLKPLAVHNDNDFETETATRNLDEMSRKLGVPLLRIRSRSMLGLRITAEKFSMNAPYGPALIVDQTCEACKYGFEAGAYNTARKRGIGLVIWGDSREESTMPYHHMVPQAHPRPSTLKRVFSPKLFSVFKYRYYFAMMRKEYGPDTPGNLEVVHLYDYVRWDQELIVRTIREHLGWSVPEDSPTTWRVDCKLVPVVNHLTEKAFGVSKIELGFSSMIRSGKMDRADALARVEKIRQNTDIKAMKNFLRGMSIPRRDIELVM